MACINSKSACKWFLHILSMPASRQSLSTPSIVFALFVLQTGCFDLDGVDEAYEFLRLKQSMDMVGFSSDTQRK